MRCSCQTTTKVATVNFFCDSELLASASAYFNIILCPKILVSQRICKLEEQPLKIKIVLKVLNYETRCFQNIQLVNTITPTPATVSIEKCDGICKKEGNNIVIEFPCIPPLSVQTVELDAKLISGGEYSSIACLREVYYGKTCGEIIRSSICKKVL